MMPFHAGEEPQIVRSDSSSSSIATQNEGMSSEYSTPEHERITDQDLTDSTTSNASAGAAATAGALQNCDQSSSKCWTRLKRVLENRASSSTGWLSEEEYHSAAERQMVTLCLIRIDECALVDGSSTKAEAEGGGDGASAAAEMD